MDNREREMVNAQGRAGTNFVELSEMNAVIDLLNALIISNRGMIEVYQTAVARLENEANIELLQNYAEQHETFATELSNLVAGYGGQPATDADSGSLVKRAWLTLKAAVTEGDGPLLATVAQDAQNMLEAYGDNLGEDLPEDAHDVIRTHLSQVRLAYEKLSGLSEAYNS